MHKENRRENEGNTFGGGAGTFPPISPSKTTDLGDEVYILSHVELQRNWKVPVAYGVIQ